MPELERNRLKPTGPGHPGLAWLGYCIIIVAPAIGWILEDYEVRRITARLSCLAVLVFGVILSILGKGSRQ